MPSRSDLHDILETIIGSGKAYYQPPASFQMSYPCIIYSWSNANTMFADNNPYNFEKRYQIIVIAKDPDSSIPNQIAMLPKCIFDRHYTANNLNHDVFNIYF